jgi:hypothetical protein
VPAVYVIFDGLLVRMRGRARASGHRLAPAEAE